MPGRERYDLIGGVWMVQMYVQKRMGNSVRKSGGWKGGGCMVCAKQTEIGRPAGGERKKNIA